MAETLDHDVAIAKNNRQVTVELPLPSQTVVVVQVSFWQNKIPG